MQFMFSFPTSVEVYTVEQISFNNTILNELFSTKIRTGKSTNLGDAMLPLVWVFFCCIFGT